MTTPFLNPLPPPPAGSVVTLLFQSTPQGFVAANDSANSPNNPKPGVTGPISISLDVISVESLQWTATPTQNPVEIGATISDHVRVLPRKLTLQAMVSNAGALTPRAGLLVSSSNPMIDALNFLDAAVEAGQPFDFVSGLAVYKNMCITSLRMDRSAQYSQAAKFTVEMEEIIIVSSMLVAISPNTVDQSVSNSAASEQDLGKQTPVTANSSQTALGGSSFSQTSLALSNNGVN